MQQHTELQSRKFALIEQEIYYLKSWIARWQLNVVNKDKEK